ncbi:sigma-70 family RNA polymerase sigma factor [Leeuwenhoekiella sp. Mr9]|uniref:Sigma-70 family RNA polymerase sigma factor n=1 Tax=Leeuwenhoekiella parthenopeia TaxID=2890320 RepID=A0ABS8GVV0_9FLAO|nr:sigma-70 family RNA polymerase sigma factor [Leeuwenhoekiella parthenopeia]MCC4214077.1 sigma-70 family RNA polymerase sigma factor [Leeuwenhoekiella parthenopeia]
MELNKPLLDQKITEAQCGNQAAYNYLLNSHWNLVYNFQLARTQDDFKAEEITIQTFSKAFNQLHTYDSSYQFGTWLITISKNLQIDLFRKEQSRQRHLEKDNQLNKVIDENPTAEDALITEQNLSELQTLIKKLKPHYQEMINLRYFQEMSYKEMAQKLDEPLGNVKVKLLRARRLLSDSIKKNQ